MSEEIQNAAVVVPWAIIGGVTVSGLLGFAMFLAILFRIGDLQAAIESDYVYPFIEVLLQATRSRAGTAVIIAVLVVVDLGIIIGVVAAASRMLWAFARDRGVPGWRFISKVGAQH